MVGGGAWKRQSCCLRRCRRQTECQEKCPGPSLLPNLKSSAIAPPPSSHWQKSAASAQGKAASGSALPPCHGAGGSTRSGSKSKLTQDPAARVRGQHSQGCPAGSKEACTFKSCFLEGLSVRKISSKHVSLFVCFAWPVHPETGPSACTAPKLVSVWPETLIRRQTDVFLSKRNCILISYFVKFRQHVRFSVVLSRNQKILELSNKGLFA